MRVLFTLFLCSFVLAACEQGSKAYPKTAQIVEGGTLDTSILDDDVDSYVPFEGSNALLLSETFTGTSANGHEADLRVRYKVNPSVQSAVTQSTQVVVSINKDGRATELLRQSIDTDAMEGDLEFSIEPTTSAASLVVGLDRLDSSRDVSVPTYSTIALPKAIDIKDSDLSRIVGVDAQLVPGSYTTELVGDRREHRFAVRVLAQYNNQPGASIECLDSASLAQENADLKPVIGLDADAEDNFIALEYGTRDSESPVSVSFSKEGLGVYLVMDASSSVIENGMAHPMLDAVSRMVISLGRFSDFSFRIFGTDVFELGSLRDISFDDPAGSGTALYYAMDTALEDIESYAPPQQNKLIVALSDGQDLASRNFYPEIGSHAQVRDYIAQRINTVREGQNSIYDSQLSAYFIELPGQNNNNELRTVADNSGGYHFQVSDKQGLRESLQTVTDYVGGSYDLVYSSQQTPDDTLLELQIHAGKCSDTIQLPTRYND